MKFLIRFWKWLDPDKTDLLTVSASVLIGYGFYQIYPPAGWIAPGVVFITIVFIGLLRR